LDELIKKMQPEIIARKIFIQGIVQGVGFRPFVYEQAVSNHLLGWVRNSSAGVEIEVNGTPGEVNALLDALHFRLPPLARIDNIQVENISPDAYTDFQIISSQPKPGEFIPISPDICICSDCLHELFDPANRRYRYPFINCTNCGPRFTIIEDIPYDRPMTTMKEFPMCPECGSEYKNPLDRRFHAQPTACAECGPQLSFVVNGKEIAVKENALQLARKWLKEGKIIAVKGLGGYHLACDARNEASVMAMRKRKKRCDKPFALMAFNSDIISSVCEVSLVEKELLASRQRPVVLLHSKKNNRIAPSVGPGLKTLGIMLPYTPLHYLLLEPEEGFPDLFVMTSGNMSEEPIAYQDEDGFSRLQPIADAFLNHNRPIHMRVDDSVVKEERNSIYPVRRSRGYAPDAITLSSPVPQMLAVGALLKNTFCLTREKYAFISHHIGDLENYETYRSFRDGISHYQNLFRIEPEVVACDLHPDYLSTRYANQFACERDLPLIQIQHHYAHLASVLAENHLPADEPAIGLCFDGTGYGTDGAIWGGEVLIGDCRGFTRHTHLGYNPLPGGDAGILHPSRIALAYLWKAGLEWIPSLPPSISTNAKDRNTLLAQLEHNLNTPLTSSMGRLFDAISALIGIRSEVNYEGQAAILLEAIADPEEKGSYPLPCIDGIWDVNSLVRSVVDDLLAGVSQSKISARFHNSIVQAIREIADQIRAEQGIQSITLSGGVWQNSLLFRKTVPSLESDGFSVYTHHQVPTNDGGISLGQVWIAAHHELSKTSSRME
jgi:hydrogenase maturation protein HypF